MRAPLSVNVRGFQVPPATTQGVSIHLYGEADQLVVDGQLSFELAYSLLYRLEEALALAEAAADG